jgi:hypothetical protein
MASRRVKNSKSGGAVASLVQKYILTSQTLPLILVLSTLGILFVLIRMKGIEQDYKFHEITKLLNVEKTENKELKAQRAQELSIKKLQSFSKKFDLKEPDEKHIIIIP